MHPKIYQHIRMSRSCKIVCMSNPRMSTRTKKVTEADASYSRNMLQILLQSRTKTRAPPPPGTKIYNRWLSSNLVPGVITGYVKRAMNTLLWQKYLYDTTIFWQTRQDSNVSNTEYMHIHSATHAQDAWMNVEITPKTSLLSSWGIVELFLDTLQRCTDVLLREIKVHSSSDTTMKYMDAFGVGSDDDYCLRHKHNYTSTCVK